MKTLRRITISCGCGLGLLLSAIAQSSDPAPASAAVPTPPSSEIKAEETAAAPESSPATPRAVDAAEPQPEDNSAPPKASPSQPSDLRLNFRNAPLETVLNYLSEAAGYIIELQTDVKGRVNVWSNQPVTREEALELLNSALDKNGYTAIQKGRTLTIWSKEEAKRRNLPVRSGNRPEEIPKSDEMVTQIIPVRFINAVQVSRDLQPLLPEKATMTANEGGNALIITDTQVSIRRMAEIIRALDTAIASVSSVRVFQLRYADAKALATVIKDLFAPQETTSRGGGGGGNTGAAGRFFNQFRGGGGGGAQGGGGGAGGGSNASGGRAPSPRVVAVAEERSNSIVVSAPDEQMPIIIELINQVDTNVEDITELRVFKLKFADAQETADLLTNLFADSGTTSSSQRGGSQFRFGGRGNRGTTTASSPSARLQQQSKVVAVADHRTSSVVVSAARELMGQIAIMIEDLDSDPAKKQQVYVFDVQNTDPQTVQDILQSLFPAPAYGSGAGVNSRLNSGNQNGVGSQLSNRATRNQNQSGATGFRNSTGGGIGGGGFGGGGFGGGGR